MRRVRAVHFLQTTRFWVRTILGLCILFLLAFWAKFAIVYDIPVGIRTGALADVKAYVTTKPWWFGPPNFDLNSYLAPMDSLGVQVNDLGLLQNALGKYRMVVADPHWVWIERVNP